jgi:hypothetical protein
MRSVRVRETVEWDAIGDQNVEQVFRNFVNAVGKPANGAVVGEEIKPPGLLVPVPEANADHDDLLFPRARFYAPCDAKARTMFDSPVKSLFISGESPAIAPRVARSNSRSDGGSS